MCDELGVKTVEVPHHCWKDARIEELGGQARHTERYAEELESHVSRETRRAAWKSASMDRALAGEEKP